MKIIVVSFVVLCVLLSVSGCLLFYGTPDFTIPDQVAAPGETLTLELMDYYQDRSRRKEPTFTLAAGSVGEVEGSVYTWVRPEEDTGSKTVSITGSNGLTEDTASFTIGVP
jgi:hypothetical protein